MPQSSLLTWFTKPDSVKEPSTTVPTDRHAADEPIQLPTPPQNDNQGEAHTAEHVSPQTLPVFDTTQRPLPANVELRSCRKEDITHLKRLTSLLLPIPYPEKFFREIIEDPLTNNITLLAVWHDDPGMKGVQKGRLVGAIRCRLLAHTSSHLAANTQQMDGPMLYLSTLTLLSPYRSHGIATHMLHALTKRAIKDYGISKTGAHVWEANAEGLEWYQKRGFIEVGREAGYYRRLDPQGAVVMERRVSALDLAGG